MVIVVGDVHRAALAVQAGDVAFTKWPDDRTVSDGPVEFVVRRGGEEIVCIRVSFDEAVRCIDKFAAAQEQACRVAR